METVGLSNMMASQSKKRKDPTSSRSKVRRYPEVMSFQHGSYTHTSKNCQDTNASLVLLVISSFEVAFHVYLC